MIVELDERPLAFIAADCWARMAKACLDPFYPELLDVAAFVEDLDGLAGEAQAEHWRMA